MCAFLSLAQSMGILVDDVNYLLFDSPQRYARVDKASLIPYSGTLYVRPYVFKPGYPMTPYEVIEIGSWAFYNSSELKSVSLPEGINEIGEGAFQNCPKLTSVNLPEGLKTIGSYAFEGTGLCPHLPNSLEKIGDYAFGKRYCDVELPENLKSIGTGAFKDVTMDELKVYSTNLETNKSKTPFGTKSLIGVVTFADNVTIIPDNFFTGKSIGGFGTKRKVGGKYDFFRYYLPSSLKYIGINAFQGCKLLSYLNIDSKNLDKINISAFQDCINLRAIYIPNIIDLNSYSFAGCKNISQILTGDKLKFIDRDAFMGSNVDRMIWLSIDPPSNWKTINAKYHIAPNEKYTASDKNVLIYPNLAQHFYMDGVLYVPSIPSQKIVDIIGNEYDSRCKEISFNTNSINYQDINFKIGKVLPYAFAGNNYLQNFNGKKLPNIPTGLFQNCINLTNVILPEGLMKLEPYLFMNTALKTFKIDDTVVEIGEGVFDGCAKLESVYFSNSIEKIGNSAFKNCSSLVNIKCDSNVKIIGENAFNQCTSLQRFECTTNLESIGKNAFLNCSNLKYLLIGGQIIKIGENAFRGCSGIENLCIQSEIPPVIKSSDLGDIDKWHCILHVPQGCANEYSNATGWMDFFHIIDDLESYSSVSNVKLLDDNMYDVYNFQGILIKKAATLEELYFLPTGLYIIGGKKYIIK